MASPLYPADQDNRFPGLYVYHNCQASTSYHPSGPVPNNASQEQYNGGPLRRHPSHQYSRSKSHTCSSSGNRRLASRTSSSERPSYPLARSNSICRSYCISPLQLPPLQYEIDRKKSGPQNFPHCSSNSKIPAPVNSLARARITRERPTRQLCSPSKANSEAHFQLQRTRSRRTHVQTHHLVDLYKLERTTTQQSQRISSLDMDTDYGTLGATLANPFADPDPPSRSGVQTENMSEPRSQLRVVNDDDQDKDYAASVTTYSMTSKSSTSSTGDGHERRSSTAASTPPPLALAPSPPQEHSTVPIRTQHRILRARMLHKRLHSRLSYLHHFAVTLTQYTLSLSQPLREKESIIHAPWYEELDTLQRLVDASLQQGDLETWDRIMHLLGELEKDSTLR